MMNSDKSWQTGRVSSRGTSTPMVADTDELALQSAILDLPTPQQEQTNQFIRQIIQPLLLIEFFFQFHVSRQTRIAYLMMVLVHCCVIFAFNLAISVMHAPRIGTNKEYY